MPLPIWAQSGQRVKISLKDETDTPSSSKQAQQMAVDNNLFRRSVHWAYHMDKDIIKTHVSCMPQSTQDTVSFDSLKVKAG